MVKPLSIMKRTVIFTTCVLSICGTNTSQDQSVDDGNVLLQQAETSAASYLEGALQAQRDKAAERVLSLANQSVWDQIERHPRGRQNRSNKLPKVTEAARLMKEASQYVVKSLYNMSKEETAQEINAGSNNTPKISKSVIAPGLIAVEVARILQAVITGRSCLFVNAFLFFVVGGLTLVKEEKLSPYDAVIVLFQQLTSVGYGSNTPMNTDESNPDYSPEQQRVWKMFHGIHAWFGNLMLDGEMKDAWKASTQMFTRQALKMGFSRHLVVGLNVIITTLVWSLIYMKDQGSFADAFYMTLMTMSTVGYGDLSPKKSWGKAVSPLYMIWGISSYESLTELLSGAYQPVMVASEDYQGKEKAPEPGIIPTLLDGIHKWWTDCWESNKDISIRFSYMTGAGPNPHCDSNDMPAPKKIVNALAKGWKLSVGLDISQTASYVPAKVQTYVKEGGKMIQKEQNMCIFWMRINNVPWKKLDETVEKLAGGQDSSLQEVQRTASQHFRNSGGCAENENEVKNFYEKDKASGEFYISCKKECTKKGCVQLDDVAVDELYSSRKDSRVGRVLHLSR